MSYKRSIKKVLGTHFKSKSDVRSVVSRSGEKELEQKRR